MGNCLAIETFKRNLQAHKIPDSPESRDLSSMILRSDLQGFAVLVPGFLLSPKVAALSKWLRPARAMGLYSAYWVLFAQAAFKATQLPERGILLLEKLNAIAEGKTEEMKAKHAADSPYLYAIPTDQVYSYGLLIAAGERNS